MSRFVSRKQCQPVEAGRPPLRVLYGLSEPRVRRYGPAGGVFQRLLAGRTNALAAGELSEAPLCGLDLSELLVASGWHHFGSSLSGGAYRVVIAQRDGSRHGRLTVRELGVAELMARGWNSQRAGLELGIAAPTVRGALCRCLAKLELASAIQLPLLWHALRSPARRFEALDGAGYLVFQVPFERLLAPLTNAERSLLERSLDGGSYRSIAAHRGVSVRTVANQMARLFEKLEVSSRVELVARLIELGAARGAGLPPGGRAGP